MLDLAADCRMHLEKDLLFLISLSKVVILLEKYYSMTHSQVTPRRSSTAKVSWREILQKFTW